MFRKKFVFDRFTLQINLGDKSGGVSVNQSFKYILFINVFIHKV